MLPMPAKFSSVPPCILCCTKRCFSSMCFAFLLPPILVAMLSLDSKPVCVCLLLLSLLFSALPAGSFTHVVFPCTGLRYCYGLWTCSEVDRAAGDLCAKSCCRFPCSWASCSFRIGVDVDLYSILVRNGCWHFDVVQVFCFV